MHVIYIPGSSDGKESACNASDLDLIPGLGRSPGEGNGNPLQYSCLENSMDRGVWWTIVHGVAKRQTQLSYWHTSTLFYWLISFTRTLAQWDRNSLYCSLMYSQFSAYLNYTCWILEWNICIYNIDLRIYIFFLWLKPAFFQLTIHL